MPPPRKSPQRATLFALVAIAILAAAMLWVAQAIVAHNTLQNCLDSGRRTCLPSPG